MFVRTRADRSDMARPPDVGDVLWKQSDRQARLRAIREYKERIEGAGGASSSSAVPALRSFTVELPKRVASTFPPIDAPPPEGVVRRIVVEKSSGFYAGGRRYRGLEQGGLARSSLDSRWTMPGVVLV